MDFYVCGKTARSESSLILSKFTFHITWCTGFRQELVYRARSKSDKLKILLYLRNLLTHTANTLLHKLNYVKLIQIFVVKQKFNIIRIMCENFRIKLSVLCNIQTFQYQRVKTESHKNWNLG